MTTTSSRRFGFKRWIILGLAFLGGYLAFGMGGIFKPTYPAVVIPGEKVWLSLGKISLGAFELTLTNTMLATLVADLVLILVAWGAYRFARTGQLVPQGFYNFFEFLVEFLWNSTQAAAGKWSKQIFPIMATIFLLVFTANMTKLFPGFESIGYMKEAHGNIQGYEPVELIPGFLWTIDGGHPVEHTTEAAAAEGEHSAEAGHGEAEAAAGELEEACKHACEVVPFLRGSATDLNFTFALAIAAVFMTQVFGVRALGPGYFVKFFNFGAIVSKPGLGLIDFGVGLLELISEFSKILSFSFRLFGNIFAGALLLSILGTLTVVLLPVGLYLFELFFGAIQAYVFAMLSLVFMSQATVSHHGDHHDEAHAEGQH